jgi:hypothetical protein
MQIFAKVVMMARENVTQTQVRLPNELLEVLKVSAERNLRSLNAEIIYQLQAGMGITPPHATPEQVREIVTDIVRTELKRK